MRPLCGAPCSHPCLGRLWLRLWPSAPAFQCGVCRSAWQTPSRQVHGACGAQWSPQGGVASRRHRTHRKRSCRWAQLPVPAWPSGSAAATSLWGPVEPCGPCLAHVHRPARAVCLELPRGPPHAPAPQAVSPADGPRRRLVQLPRLRPTLRLPAETPLAPRRPLCRGAVCSAGPAAASATPGVGAPRRSSAAGPVSSPALLGELLRGRRGRTAPGFPLALIGQRRGHCGCPAT